MIDPLICWYDYKWTTEKNKDEVNMPCFLCILVLFFAFLVHTLTIRTPFGLKKKTNKKKQKQKTIKQLNIKKRSRFSKQNNNFAPVSQFLVHCFAVTVRGLPREIAFRNFTIEGGRKKTTTNFPFSFSVNLESGSKNPSAGEFA